MVLCEQRAPEGRHGRTEAWTGGEGGVFLEQSPHVVPLEERAELAIGHCSRRERLCEPSVNLMRAVRGLAS